MLFKELIMKKNILFILILTIILGFVCIIYFGDSEVQMKNSLKKIGYNDEESEKILNVFSDDINCIYDNYISDITGLLNHKDFNSENKCLYIKYIKDNNVNASIAIEMVNASLENYDYSDYLYNIKNDSYFLLRNTDRYIDYYKKNMQLSTREIVSAVNANIDYDYYTNIKVSENQDSLLVIVNKYHTLDSSYVPQNLVNVSYPYGYGKVDKTLYENFKKMADAARSEGLNIYISSGYRSYDYQKALYNGYTKIDPVSVVDTYSARPGHSEHQTGLAIDLNTISSSFAYTNEFKWLINNAYKYGFILRYPKDDVKLTGYMYEPWHYRYVGNDVAEYIYKNNITFDEYYEYFLAN